MRFVWAGENAAIALGCAPNEEVFVDSLQFAWQVAEIEVCCLLHLLLSLFISESTVGIFPHALSEIEATSLDTSSQHVKRMCVM